jgi:hypothetical protein
MSRLYVQPVAEALLQIAVDDVGRDALRSKLKAVRFEAASERDVRLDAGGNLTLAMNPAKENAVDIADRRITVVAVLERGL